MAARVVRGLLLVGLTLGLLFVGGLFILLVNFSGWDFRNNLWGPAHLVWLGRSAYAIHLLFPDGSNAIWLPQAIGVFLPVGLLPLQQASNLWLLLNSGALAALGWYVLRRAEKRRPEPWRLGIILLVSSLFPPTIHHFVLGQIDLMVMLAMIGAAYFTEKGRIVLAAILLAFSLTKPQLCIIVVPSAVAYLIIMGRLKSAVSLMIFTPIAGAVMTMPMWLADISWWNDLLANLRRNPRWEQPSTLWLIEVHVGLSGPGILIFGLIFAGCLLAAVYLWLRTGPVQGTVWGVALTTIAGTYMWSWDFVLLLPLLVDTAARAKQWQVIIGLLGIWLGALVFTLLSFQPAPASNARLWWLPYWVILGLVACRWAGRLGRNPGRPAQIMG